MRIVGHLGFRLSRLNSEELWKFSWLSELQCLHPSKLFPHVRQTSFTKAVSETWDPLCLGRTLSNVWHKIMNEAKEFATCAGSALTGHEENLKIFWVLHSWSWIWALLVALGDESQSWSELIQEMNCLGQPQKPNLFNAFLQGFLANFTPLLKFLSYYTHSSKITTSRLLVNRLCSMHSITNTHKNSSRNTQAITSVQ